MAMMNIIYLLAALMVVLALLAVLKSSRRELSEKASRQFADTAGILIESRDERQDDQRTRPIQQLFWRAGMQPRQSHIAFVISLTVLLVLLTVVMKGLVAALLVPVLVSVLIYAVLWQRANRRIKAILTQLPLLLDQVLRALGTGRSMESALQLAVSETPDPLHEIFERVLRMNQLGNDLGEAIQEAANLYRIQELHLVALAIRVNRTYGSSVRDLLNNIVKMIHDREAARRELKTMTGETRVTAWVLGLLPLFIAGYILMMNPDYMMSMWEDDAGQIMLITAVIFQALGGFTLWRMIKSI